MTEPTQKLKLKKHAEVIAALDYAFFEDNEKYKHLLEQPVTPVNLQEFTEDATAYTFWRERSLLDALNSVIKARQWLPYTVFTKYDTQLNEWLVFVYQRTKLSGESRLAGDYSVGIGGHVNTSTMAFKSKEHRDAGVFDLKLSLAVGAIKEINEEVTIWLNDRVTNMDWSSLLKDGLYPIILDNSNEVGQYHIGVVNVEMLDGSAVIEMKEDANITVGWKTIKEAMELPLESWSKLALSHARSVIDAGFSPQPNAAPPLQPCHFASTDTLIRAMQERTGLNVKESIVDLLRVLDLPYSPQFRKLLAKNLGYVEPEESTNLAQASTLRNIWLHKTIIEGLVAAGSLDDGPVVTTLTDTASQYRWENVTAPALLVDAAPPTSSDSTLAVGDDKTADNEGRGVTSEVADEDEQHERLVGMDVFLQALRIDNPDLNVTDSVVDLLKALNLPSSEAFRKRLAQKLGYTEGHAIGENVLGRNYHLNSWLHYRITDSVSRSGISYKGEVFIQAHAITQELLEQASQ